MVKTAQADAREITLIADFDVPRRRFSGPEGRFNIGPGGDLAAVPITKGVRGSGRVSHQINLKSVQGNDSGVESWGCVAINGNQVWRRVAVSGFREPLLVAMVSSNSVTFEELLDGVGGLDRLSILVLQYRSLLGDPMCRALDPLFIILRDHSAVPILTAAACALAEAPGSAVAIPLEKCLGALERIFSDISGYRWLSSALKNGLLLAVVLASQLHPGDHVHDHLTFLVTLMACDDLEPVSAHITAQSNDSQSIGVMAMTVPRTGPSPSIIETLSTFEGGDSSFPWSTTIIALPKPTYTCERSWRCAAARPLHHGARRGRREFRAHGEEWAEGVARAARSGGSQELHVVRVIQGRVGRVLLVPLRQSPEDVDGALKETLLREMADELPPGDDEVRLSAFLRKFEVKTDELDRDVLETH
ncbi:hypothetical protein DFH09DRAFT_1391250 [Mycena vulgaris]|nr:hypothetical protein DFH09DRAFT_1391250 [Mycena vulgaris]